MKFEFQYRTRDNVLHGGTIRAADKDAAFAALRSKGLKPSRLTEAPGFFNALFGKGKRWMAIAVLSALLLLTPLFFADSRAPASDSRFPTVSERHQIYGDPAIISEMTADGFASVLTCDGERFLAGYAMPGEARPSAVRLKSADDLAACLTNEIAFAEGEPREVAELKAIVNGLKEELRDYLSDGEGTCASFIRRLEERQEEERMIYRRVRNELEENPDPALWEERNKALREMGIRTIPRPRPRKQAS